MSPSARIEAAAGRHGRVRRALATASELHRGDFRETGAGEIPFIDHPVAVGDRLAEEGFGPDVLAAGLLHDVLEYTHVPLDRLRERFGVDVSGLVYALTENLEIDDYEERKQELRERVAWAGHEARMVFAADKLVNVEVLRGAYALKKEAVDEDLPIDLDLKILVWEYDLEMLFENSDGEPLTTRFAEEMLGLWGQRSDNSRPPGPFLS